MIRKHSKIAALVMGAALAVTAFAAWSARSQMVETYYFDENGYLVGEELIACEGRPNFWGVRTANSQSYYTNCEIEPPFSWD